MDNNEKLEKILRKITENGDILNDTNPSMHIHAIALEEDKKGGLLAFGHNEANGDYFVASNLQLWEPKPGVEKVCWGAGAYFDGLVEAMRYYFVFKNGLALWNDRTFEDDLVEYQQSAHRIISIDQIKTAIWDLHTYECNRRENNGKPVSEGVELASYEALTAAALSCIGRWHIDGGQDIDIAFGHWYFRHATEDLDQAFKNAERWCI